MRLKLPQSRTLRLATLAAPAVIALALVGVLLVRSFTGAGPRQSGASTTVESLAESQREVDEAIRDARQFNLMDKPAKAFAVLQNAVNTHRADADLRVALGETLLALDKPAEAYQQYNEAIGLSPDTAELQFAAGTVASVAGLFDRAAQHYRDAQRLDTGNPKYPLYLGQVQRKLGQVEEAKASLVRAAELEPDLAIAWGTLADIEYSENKLEMAEHYLDKALKIEPASSAWRLIKARILRRRGEPEEAALILDAIASEQETPDPMILREQALSLGLLGRQEEAMKLYDRAIAIGHPDRKTLAELNYEGALWHERLGDPQTALEYARRAQELGDERAGQVVARLTASRK